ncbi:hypothetical protein ACTXT7_010212 [Hymenolepis weldensis]
MGGTVADPSTGGTVAGCSMGGTVAGFSNVGTLVGCLTGGTVAGSSRRGTVSCSPTGRPPHLTIATRTAKSAKVNLGPILVYRDAKENSGIMSGTIKRDSYLSSFETLSQENFGKNSVIFAIILRKESSVSALSIPFHN